MFCWNSDMLAFMADAAAYGDYYKELAAILAPYLPPEGHVCDAGCGPGYLSLALAPFVHRVSGVEISPDALAILSDSCKVKCIDNIVPVCGDIHDCPPATGYDAMVFSFFGHIDEILALAASQCNGMVLILTKAYENHRFSVGTHAIGHGFSAYEARLAALGIPHEAQRLSLEAGQPLRDMAAARRFFALYSRDGDPSLITDDFLRSRLTETGREDFPLYLPQRREIGLLRLHSRDIPDDIQHLIDERKSYHEKRD